MSAIRTMLGYLSLVSTLAAGALGMLTIRAVGPSLAMGAQMWLGNTDPVRPHLVWPHVATFVALVLPAPFLYRQQLGLATAAALPFALLPYWQLWRLYLAAAAPDQP